VPFLVLVNDQRSDNPNVPGIVREHPDHLRTRIDLLILNLCQSLQRVLPELP